MKSKGAEAAIELDLYHFVLSSYLVTFELWALLDWQHSLISSGEYGLASSKQTYVVSQIIV